MEPAAVSSNTPDQIRIIANTLRKQVIRMIGKAGSGHPGGSLSAADIVATLYFSVLRHDPANSKWADRDRFILSKGHAAPVLYACLAEAGYFDKDLLATLRQMGSPLQGHTDMNLVPGVDASAGSLGQGLSIGNGIALAARLDGRDCRVYVLLGDGECNEGQVWEAAMASAHYRLENVVAIIDKNGLQIDGRTTDVMNTEPMADKWRAFGWHTIEVDGHSIPELLAAFEVAKQTKGKPTAIVAKTVKGKGVSFMENNVDFHGKAPSAAEVEKALEDLERLQ
ncbi:MAG: transketolase [Dehalococcoidia bacterium]|nr:transketolase [Dehalococcoidia bacterium]